MTRIRRISVEVIRRELSLSITKQGAVRAQAPTDAVASEGECPASSTLSTKCPACASPWLVLPVGEGEEAIVLQRLLKTQGIHHLMSTRGELFVCARSFDLHAGAGKNTDTTTSDQTQKNIPSQSPSHD